MEKAEERHINPQQFSADVRDFLRLLAVNNVRYVIVGGQAVIFYGHARMTGDVDIFYDNSPANAEALFNALDAFWEGNIPGIDSADELQEEDLILQFGRPPNRLDLISDLTGVEFEEAWHDRETGHMKMSGEDVMIHFIGHVQLLNNKKAVGRPKDRDDYLYLKSQLQSQ